jgi:hypothetical protein
MIRVIQSFKDKVTGEVYPIGKELELDEERTKDLINRGLVVVSKKKKK